MNLQKIFKCILCILFFFVNNIGISLAEGEAIFYPVELMDNSTFQPEVVGENTRRANSKDWPATFFESKTQCTANLVGPRAVLLAAHCVTNYGNRISLAFLTKSSVSGYCTTPKDYRRGSSDDYALCQLISDVDVQLYESLQLRPSVITKKRKLLLAGFGCHNTKDAKIQDTDFKFYLGYSEIKKLPEDQLQNPARINFIETYGKAGLSTMDSGGCAFLVNGESEDVTSRVCVGIAHAEQASSCGPEERTSTISSLSTEEGDNFVKGWEKDKTNGADICGVTPGMQKCRQY